MKTEVKAVVLDKLMVELGTMAYADSVADSASKRNLDDSATLDCKFQKRVHLWAFDRMKNSTHQLHESIVIEWMCKCECRTHRESALLKTNFKVLKLKISQPSPNIEQVTCIK
jgi:hypothetical protein